MPVLNHDHLKVDKDGCLTDCEGNMVLAIVYTAKDLAALAANWDSESIDDVDPTPAQCERAKTAIIDAADHIDDSMYEAFHDLMRWAWRRTAEDREGDEHTDA